MDLAEHWEVIVVGAGLAGVSACIYLGRALRRTLLLDDGRSLALWEPDVQNYLGFPEGIAGAELLRRGQHQAARYGVGKAQESVRQARRVQKGFLVDTGQHTYTCSRLLLATGLFHLPPEIPGVEECLGHSMFFCKDCDAYRVQGSRIAIIGRNNDAVEYALGMLLYSPRVVIATNGKACTWDPERAQWTREYEIPVLTSPIVEVEHRGGKILSLRFADQQRLAVDSIFTTRGDVYHNVIAQGLGADLDPEGQIAVNERLQTSVPGLYAAGCVTPANCQMIIAAGQGAAAAQAINRDLFEESLRTHALRRFRKQQVDAAQTVPDVRE